MKVLAAVLAALTIVGVIVGVIAFQAWIAMLLLGALHNSVHDAIPALGFWASVVVVLALNFVGGFFRNVSAK